ncbi:site-specific integrase [Burkholderia ambifaria]|uniref:site-specific integrase n=1 Tax=Burkholderia ambifaria TaxID=152480 RepID=UPI00158F3560|nr:site-specific integrase [Burkholderia ambifaria]QQJ96424.1 site-specific integrase [Burkholderia ambifaria]
MPLGWTCRVLVLGTHTGIAQVWWPLVEYFITFASRSDAWQMWAARAFGLLYDYVCLGLEDSQPAEILFDEFKLRQVLRGFSRALLYGCSKQVDARGILHWDALPLDSVRRIISAIHEFAKQYAFEHGRGNPIMRPATANEVMLAAAAGLRRDRESLLSYLHKENRAKHSAVALPADDFARSYSETAPLSFPPYAVELVLLDGFLRRNRSGTSWDDYDVRGMMIFLLQAFTGLREHEPLHMWVEDVIENPEEPGLACVRLYHPENGLAYKSSISGVLVRTTRKAKLLEYGLCPRNRGVGSYRIGWKHSAYDKPDCCSLLQWTDPNAAAMFLELFRYYVARRAQIMSRRLALGYGDHPFLFVSEREARNVEDGLSSYGAPASIASYDDSLRRAVKKIGLIPEKSSGTTSHGPRHLYAYTLRKLGVGKKVLQIALRHSSANSSDRYGCPGPADINRDLQRASRTSEQAETDKPERSQIFEWINRIHPEYKR